mmetsp:Transcript_7615/g.14918  ORF Transcript_7615/g.14918 Transcript_7615/m.14918 type:complete len:103 (-) Transcript_7615:270-578(-)|eukprot:CAMPEP_0170180538 /NCGR_PEP_ID=MMETSP0040_2-20121228/22210_1 /TAXON_ID=641309 /ORGANISM="Lotharella oceanica, Strain CCMP622" /LENGTH=102 /DNA_ID=CAMNT_0010425209 /DNA_START=317 /DNA_END=625 /DNA_ORIENTATION=+
MVSVEEFDTCPLMVASDVVADLLYKFIMQAVRSPALVRRETRVSNVVAMYPLVLDVGLVARGGSPGAVLGDGFTIENLAEIPEAHGAGISQQMLMLPVEMKI